MALYFRPTLAEHVDAGAIFDVTRHGLDYFQEKFGKYPFTKYDQVFAPEFRAGAMENPGCVIFRDAYLFRSAVTASAYEGRANTILHEMAHMWFGDLVTMRWWGDLWLNESFATFAATLAQAAAPGWPETWTTFALAKVRARSADQMPSAHPIVSGAPDMQSAEQNFDAISYQKGAAVLQQLMATIGEEAFFGGLQLYFERHGWGNAEFGEFLAAIEERSGRDLGDWAHRWLETAGVSTLSVSSVSGETDGGASCVVVQETEGGETHMRSHQLSLDVYASRDGGLFERTRVSFALDGARAQVPIPISLDRGDLLLINAADLTYAKLGLDQASAVILSEHVGSIPQTLARTVGWTALWDMTVDARLPPSTLVRSIIRQAPGETNLMLLQALLGWAARAIDALVAPGNSAALRDALSVMTRAELVRCPAGSDQQLAWADACIGSARSNGSLEFLRRLLDGTTVVPGLAIDIDMRWKLVHALCAVGHDADELIAAEILGDGSDLGQRHAAAARAAIPTVEAKQQAWKVIAGDGADSYSVVRSMMSGFQRADQAQLLTTYVQPYFEQLPALWDSRPREVALAFTAGMYPHSVVSDEVVDLAEDSLRNGLPQPMSRILRDAQFSTRRAIRTRSLDAEQVAEAVGLPRGSEARTR